MLFRKFSTTQRTFLPPSPRNETIPNIENSNWIVDKSFIAQSLSVLPQSPTLSAEDKLAFFNQVFQANVEKSEWVDFEFCMYQLGIYFKVFPSSSSLNDFKWVFWTENDLNLKLTNLLLGLNLPSRNFPDFQLGFNLLVKEETAKRVVIAIDFGSTHSGYAYAFTTPPQTIHIPKLFAKQPTAALFNSKLELLEFGNEAKEMFMRSLAGDILLNRFTGTPTEHAAISQELLYFESLKMRLFDSNYEAQTCHTMNSKTHLVPLLTIVSKILEYLKKQALSECECQASEVLWVLTVPAIWTEKDKAFMRKAAFNAGWITREDSTDLVLALEPECAALAAKASTEKVSLAKNAKLLTLDCGGGTVDCCAIQVLSESPFSCKQLLPPSGGNWGGTQIDKEFVRFFDEFMGENFFDRVSEVNPAVLIGLMGQWEKLKCSLTLTDFLDAEMNAKSRVKKTLDLSGVMHEATQSLSSLCKRFNANSVFQVTSRSESILTTNAIKLALPMNLLASFFLPTLNAIVDHARYLFRTYPEELRNLNQILLVGGLGSNPYLHFKFETTFPNLHVLHSFRSSALVEVGAVKFGLQPSVFQSRKSNITLGVKTTVEFRESIHVGPLYREHKFYDANTKRYFVRNIFKPFLIAGEEVSLEKKVVQDFRANNKESDSVKFEIYSCGDKPPTSFVTEEGCSLLVQLLVPVTKGEMAELELGLKVGFTEISIEVIKKKTGELVLMKQVLFDF